ncbi:hypothetical protein GOP47_0019128 [Adiantum capillus-veneris]|uniref:Pentatricopeptide repeat-containing protein n=1 Tax=Adiantum capillus-veneris TaxID=13818 RepID=A0A9D4Z9D3_ADICA|nr:hypothetical protein GOP47_0019128 [Adiantum capillus-veneris]
MTLLHLEPQRFGNLLGHSSALVDALQRLESKEKPSIIYPLLIKALGQISSLPSANKLYAYAVSAGLEKHNPLSICLIDLYSRCNSIQDAHALFRSMADKRIASYNTIIAACVKHGHHEEALSLFANLFKTQHAAPNKITFIRALGGVSHHKAALQYGMIMHTLIVDCGLHSDLFISNAILSMYNRYSCLDEAERVFKQMSTRDVVSWTTMIDMYVQLNDKKRSLQLFCRMQSAGVQPNAVTYMTLVKLFSTPAALAEAKEIHALIRQSGLELDPLLGNTLISMYGKCGNLAEARAMYSKLNENDVISWNSIVAAYAQQGFCKNALSLFRQGFMKGLKPNSVTFVSTLDACAGSKALAEGQSLHSLIQEKNIYRDIVLETALLNMYGKCGSVEDAKHVFDGMATHNVVSWTAIISAFSQHGHARDALNAFYQLMVSSVRPNNVTFVAILEACTNPDLQAEGRLIHFAAVWNGLDVDSTVGNALLNMYSNCGQIDDSLTLFDMLPTHDVIAWTAMIGTYSQYGHGDKALELFARMLRSTANPNNVTLVCVLDTCADLSTLAEGKLTHAYMVELQLDLDRDLGTALVNMYGKCGSVEEAYNIFLVLGDKDLVCWNLMFAAYAQHGHGKLALQLFHTMENERVQPNSYTFISVLNACSHAGLVELGHQYLDSMKPKYGVTPTSEHYVCMVDLLGRAGRLEEAEKFIRKMPLPPSAALWMSFLSACRLHSSLEWGAVAAENVRKLEPQNLAPYVVLSNIYAALGRWDDLAKIGDCKFTGV